MNRKIFNHMRKIIIVVAIIIMCTSHSIYAFSNKNTVENKTNFIQSLINVLFNIKEKEEIIQTESEQKHGDDNSRSSSFIKGLISNVFNIIKNINEAKNYEESFETGVENNIVIDVENNIEDSIETTEKQNLSASEWSLKLDESGVTYGLYTPANVEKYKNIPVIVWLHGQENPTKNDELFMSYLKTEVFGNANNMTNVLDGEIVYVVAPHFTGEWRKNDCWCDTKNNVAVIEKMIENFLLEHKNADENNIVIAGHSMGAQGALFFAEYLNCFSKVALLSGYVPKCGKDFSNYNLQSPGICYIGEDDDPVSKNHTGYIVKKFNMEKAFSFTGSSHKSISQMAFSDDTGMHIRDGTEMDVVI